MTWVRRSGGGSLFERAMEDQSAIEAAMSDCLLPDGSTMRVLDQGHGEAVVFMPMVRELNFVYAHQMEELGPDHRLLLYEPRLSRTRRVGLRERACDVVDLLDARGIESAHVVAWSDTGSAAYVLAKTFPARCRSMVFLGLADRYRFPAPLQFGMHVLSRLPVEGLLPARVLAGILSHYLGGQQAKASWVARRARQIPELSRLFKHSVLPNLLDHAPQPYEISTPALVVCGDEDALVTPEQARRMAALLPASGAAVIVPGGEHFLGYVSPDPVNEAIRCFYASLDGSSRRSCEIRI